jgi:hypothetical protein
LRRTLALSLAAPLALVLLAGGPASDDVATSSTDPVPVAQPEPLILPPAIAPTPRPSPQPEPEPAPATPDAEGTVAAPPREAEQREGPVESTFLIASAPEAGAVAGTGRRWRYTVEVEPGLGIDPELLAFEVRAALNDERSWARTRTLEQVSDPTQARIRLVLASPDTVDELCGRAGLNTAGIYSCWNGRFAALNSWRWEFGADGFDDITTYRNYLVNHEFGHGLGFGHAGCPAEGELAPVMMQQSKGHDGCVANGWPYP